MAERLNQNALDVAATSFDRVQNWLKDAISSETKIETSSTATSQTSTPFLQHVRYQDRIGANSKKSLNYADSTCSASPAVSLKQRLDSTSSSIARLLAGSPLVRRAQTYLYRSDNRRRISDYYLQRNYSPVMLQTKFHRERTSRSLSSITSSDRKRWDESTDFASDTNLKTFHSPDIKNSVFRMKDSIRQETPYAKVLKCTEEHTISCNDGNDAKQNPCGFNGNLTNSCNVGKRYKVDASDSNNDVFMPSSPIPTIFENLPPPQSSKNTENLSKMNFSDIPKLKLSIQYMNSNKQIQVIMSEVLNLDRLCSARNQSKIYLKVSLTPGNIQRKTIRKIRRSSNIDFHDMFVFQNVNMDAQELRLRIFQKQRCVCLLLINPFMSWTVLSDYDRSFSSRRGVW